MRGLQYCGRNREIVNDSREEAAGKPFGNKGKATS